MKAKLMTYIHFSIMYIFTYFGVRSIYLEELLGSDNLTFTHIVGILICLAITIIWLTFSNIYHDYILSKERREKWDKSLENINFYTSPVVLKVTLFGVILLEFFVFEFVF